MGCKRRVATLFLLGAACGVCVHSAAAASNGPALTDVSQRTPTSLDEMYERLVSRRNLQMARLRSYSARGRFPLNMDFPGQLVPYFVDRFGTACAVGHLMRQDCEETLVSNIAASCNHVRIEDVHSGPLLDWIADSGLTKDECALIQPSYARIEDYRSNPKWREEIARLRAHFARVEETLGSQSPRSLEEALRSQVDEEIHRQPDSLALSFRRLSKALASDEPNIRIGAAYALGRLKPEAMPRGKQIAALEPNLTDPVLAVRFWTAVALERIGSASSAGSMELHQRTLPIFLETFRGDRDDLRLLALIQMADTAPECINTNRQLRLIPEIRHTFVDACSDDDPQVRAFARQTLSTWRWQQIVHESHRMRQQYLAGSHELESLAAEALAMDREFVQPPPVVEALRQARSMHDVAESITYMAPVWETSPVSIAATEAQAAQIVDDWFRVFNLQHNEEGTPPFWKIGSTEADQSGTYFLVTALRTDRASFGTKMLYVLPRPSMLLQADALPSHWLETVHQYSPNFRSNQAPSTIHARAGVHVVLGEAARRERGAFTATCDVFAYFMTYYARLVIDRNVEESDKQFIWSGRFANLRQHSSRFFRPGGGGWDFYQITFTCDRSSGELAISAEPIEFAATPVPNELSDASWRTDELKLMGWKPLKSIDQYASTLLPAEYGEAVELFLAGDHAGSRQLMYRRHRADESLPRPEIILGLLFEKTGHHEIAVLEMARAAGYGKDEPHTLAAVARWAFSTGSHQLARKHAEASLQLHPDNSMAKGVLIELSEHENRDTSG